MINPLKPFWQKQHIGKKSLDLGAGYLDRTNFRYHPYSNVYPNLILLGSQNCGTSSLAHYLSFHPDIHVSSPLKEPGFYIVDEWAKEYWRQHGRVFKNRNELLRKGMLSGYSGQRYFLDATTRYTLGSSSKDMQIPDKLDSKAEKCIYIVRNPFRRMISSYNNFYIGRVPESFNERFDVDSSILETSLYYKQILPYADVIGAENIHVLIFEEFVADVPSSMNQIFEFLDVECILPYSEFPVMNKTAKIIRYLYSQKNFEYLSAKIVPDVEQLQNFLGRTLDWDLSSKKWVEET